MDIRQETELLEKKTLSKYASLSVNSVGRAFEEEPCSLRTCYQRDRDRIIHSKAFRRLMHKTQAFISPEGDHYRTRLTHTLEVSQIARTISRCLRLNEDLTEAIALGHDLGHTPFGHLGEDDLNRVVPGGFHHNEQSVRVVEKIEKNGKGLNLSREVLDGILNHRGAGTPSTLEGKVVQISDKIAYINHDIDDAIRAGVLTNEMLPKECIDILGDTHKKRIDFLIKDIVRNSLNKNDIIMTTEVRKAMYDLRAFMFKNVYNAGVLSEERNKFGGLLNVLYSYYLDNFDELPYEFKKLYLEHMETEREERVIADYIAGMTDRFAKKTYSNLGDKLKKYI